MKVIGWGLNNNISIAIIPDWKGNVNKERALESMNNTIKYLEDLKK